MLEINNQIVEKIIVREEYDGEIKSFRISQNDNLQNKLEEIYNFIKGAKRADKEMGWENGLNYHIELRTADTLYGDYKIVKHRNNTYSIEVIRS